MAGIKALETPEAKPAESTEAPDTQEGSDDSGTETETDWQSLAQELKQEKDTLQHKFDSLSGQTLKDSELRDRMTSTENGVSALGRKFDLVVEALGDQNDGLSERAQKITDESAQAQESRTMTQQGDLFRNSITTAIEDSGLPNDDPGVQEIVALWKRATDAAYDGMSNQVTVLMSQAQHAADLLRLDTLRAGHKTELAEAKQAKKDERKRVQEEAGVWDMDTGSGSGGGEQSYEKVRDAYIADPYDAKVSKAYADARRARGV